MNFEVKVFDTSCCLKDYSLKHCTSKVPPCIEIEDSSDDEDLTLSAASYGELFIWFCYYHICIIGEDTTFPFYLFPNKMSLRGQQLRYILYLWCDHGMISKLLNSNNFSFTLTTSNLIRITQFWIFGYQLNWDWLVLMILSWSLSQQVKHIIWPIPLAEKKSLQLANFE